MIIISAETSASVLKNAPHSAGQSGFKSGAFELPYLRIFRESSAVAVVRNEARAVLQDFCGARRTQHCLDLSGVFVHEGGIKIFDDKKMLYFDDDHLSVDGAMMCRE